MVSLTHRLPNANKPCICFLTLMLLTLFHLPPKTKCNPSSTRHQLSTPIPMFVISKNHTQMDINALHVKHQTISSTILLENVLAVLKELTTRMVDVRKKLSSPMLML